MKRILALLLICIMAFSLVSCGGGDDADGKVITWYAFGEEQPDMAKVMEAANKIIEPKLGVKLDLKFIPASAYDQRLKMMMASGAEFDICFTSNWKNDYLAAARDGGLLDITDLISEDLYGIMDDKYWDDMKIDGKIYAVPNMQVMYTQLAVSVKADLVEKYDIDLSGVEHIEDIEPVLELLHEKEPNLYTYNNRWSTHPWTYDISTDVSGGVGVPAHKVTGEILSDGTPESKRGVEKIREWYQKGYIRQDYASANNDNNVTDINQGKYAVMVQGYKPGQEQTDTVKYVYKTITKPHFTGATSTALGIGAGSKNPEKALELIQLVNTNKELYNIICYGLEGVHYDLNEEGKIVKKEKSGYAPNSDWQFGNQFNAILSEGMEDDVWERTKQLNDEALVSVTTTFKLDTEPIKNELAQMKSANDEFGDYVTVKPADYEKYKKDKEAALKAAGRDKVVKEIEKQMKAHVKASKKK